MNKQGAFSLVELMVALTLLSLILFIGTYGYQSLSRYWQQDLGEFDATFSQIRGLNIFQRTVDDLKPYLLNRNGGQPYFYFEGGVSVLRSVRTHSVSNPELPAAFEIRVMAQENSELLKLEYAERPLTREIFHSSNNWQQYTYRITLMSDLEDVAFSYFGWAHFNDMMEEKSASSPKPQWYGNYSGRDTLITPLTVRMQISQNERLSVFELPVKAIREDLINYYMVSDD